MVLVGGLVSAGPCGVRDHGALLAEELRRTGLVVGEAWVPNCGDRLGPAVGAAARILWRMARMAPGSAVVWQYSPFSYGFRGVPLPGILVGAVSRLRRVRVVVVLHELAYPWGTRGLRGRLISLSQQTALRVVLWTSDAVVVTTAERATTLGGLRRWMHGRPAQVVPVYSNLGEEPVARGDDTPRIGVIGYGNETARADLLLRAIARIAPPAGLRIELLGAPGGASDAGRMWRELAARHGVADRLDFSEVLPAEAFASHLAGCDVVVLVDKEGPSGRRGMLAAALAQGRPVVATDGPNRWEALVGHRGVEVVAPVPDALAEALARLLGDPAAQVELGWRGREFYLSEASVQAAGQAFRRLVGFEQEVT